jgi:nanoRNase/pAp phosphatase (c-di-AMP/oligoRNAs hydrolase)
MFGGTYYDTATHREFSLRSLGDFDVSEIAKEFGGGGHKNAAGFKVPRSHPFASL